MFIKTLTFVCPSTYSYYNIEIMKKFVILSFVEAFYSIWIV